MNQVSTELDSLSLLFASGVRESVAFDRDMLAMQAEAAHAKARISQQARKTRRQQVLAATQQSAAEALMGRKDTDHAQRDE